MIANLKKLGLSAQYSRIFQMCTLTEGSIKVKSKNLDLDLTLLGGQSFRWEKHKVNDECEWCGVAYGSYWILKQDDNNLFYKVYFTSDSCEREDRKEEFYNNLLRNYFRLDFDLENQVKLWRQSHPHFNKLLPNMKAVRVLNQEPLENILSFICSQNNNIKRISTMIQWMCMKYGEKIGKFNSNDAYSFPSMDALNKAQDELESQLRAAKFGYRAKFIAQTIQKINEFGGTSWFEKLRLLPYQKAREELVKLPGIGFKVADCICLMSLGHMESVPIDTHIFKIAQTIYMPQLAKTKAVTPKIYDEIANHFREIYGPYAGWAQAVLFCSELQQFQPKCDKVSEKTKSKKKRCK